MSEDLEQFKKWLAVFMHVSAMAGIEDHEVVPTWPHSTDKDRYVFKDYPQLTVGAVRALGEMLGDIASEKNEL